MISLYYPKFKKALNLNSILKNPVFRWNKMFFAKNKPLKRYHMFLIILLMASSYLCNKKSWLKINRKTKMNSKDLKKKMQKLLADINGTAL